MYYSNKILLQRYNKKARLQKWFAFLFRSCCLFARYSEVYPLQVWEVLLIVVFGDVLLPVGAVHILYADTDGQGVHLLHSDVGCVGHALVFLARVERSGA